jgi:hypothetical protein
LSSSKRNRFCESCGWSWSTWTSSVDILCPTVSKPPKVSVLHQHRKQCGFD